MSDNGWDAVPLSAVAADGGVFVDGDWVESKDQDPNGEIRLTQLADVGDSFFLDKSDRWINSNKFCELQCTEVLPGDILIARMPDPIARSTILPEGLGYSVITVVDVAILRAGTGWNSRYVMWAINSSSFRNDVDSRVSGSTRQRISRSALGRTKLFRPPLETQQRIADYLDRETSEIDAAVADLDKYVELLNVKLESASREVFTELSANHPLIQIKFLVDITTGSGDTQDSQENGGFPFYVRSDTIQRAEDFEFDCDAVLTSGDGAGVGKIFHLASGKFKAHQRVYVMHNFKRVSPQYFYWMFKSAFPDAIRYGGAKSTVDSVRRPMIANLKIPVPDHDAQEKASKRIEKLHHEVSTLIAKSAKLRDLLLKRRSVLITEVVTGRKQV